MSTRPLPAAQRPHAKRFLYLIQAKNSDLPESYKSLRGEDSDVLMLTWGAEVPDCLYFPRSTWTQGRNRLLREALSSGTDYLYYIFLDDDLILRRGDWRVFEAALLKYEPAIGTPFCLDYWGMTSSETMEAHQCLHFDAMCNAFHRDVIHDGILLPYYSGLDAQSWYFSQWFVIELAYLFYPRSVLQFNTVWVDNVQHAAYAKDANLELASRWFYGEVVKVSRFSWRRLPWPRYPSAIYRRLRRCFWLGWRRFRKPSSRTGSYSIPLRKREALLNMRAEFWRKRD